MKAVILAGGMGTRLREETEYRPKPMVEIGGQPILWHIMKNLSAQGINDFIICTGYKGEYIKDYFMNYQSRTHDVTLSLGERSSIKQHDISSSENWVVTLANTGLTTMTGGRIKRIAKYVGDKTFFCTYGDGLSDVDVVKLVSFHQKHGKTATVTAVQPKSRFGSMEIDESSTVNRFIEKPRSDNWINGGFFIFNPAIFSYLAEDSILEKTPLESLAREGQLKSFKHDGFWQPMDTYRESLELNELWENGNAPWRNW